METRDSLLQFLDTADPVKIAMLESSNEGWAFDEIRSLVGQFEEFPWLVGARVGMMISDRLHAGLISMGLMNVGTCIPINPNSTQAELVKSLRSLRVEAILIDDETIAASLSKWDVTIALVSFNGRTVELEKLRSGEFRDHSSVDSVLALQTSGTTGEPKSVELSEENLRHSVESIIRSLDLGPGDVCVNLLPMVHVGGLVDLLMAPLAAEGQVIFANASEPDRVLELIRQDSISWLQGSPAILSNFVRSNQAVSSEKLRFIRSVSAPLEKSLHQRLEEFFGVPVIEIYGMSETAGVITSNPLPPGERRIGSVGVPVRCEIDIRGAGEVWARGKNVFGGYASPIDDESDWDDDWFFTGDLGRVDEAGYLYLTGRAKEQINRGGQKLAPAEIDRIVEAWPEVVEAAAFSVPHSTLGEEVGLAFVLKAGVRLPDIEMRNRLKGRLVFYKRPKAFYQVDSLPRNENGKLQRHLIYDLTKSKCQVVEEVLSPTEVRVSQLFRSALSIDRAGLDEDFFELGGDSLSATGLVAKLESEFSLSLQTLVFYESTSIRALSGFIDQLAARSRVKTKKSLVVGLSPRLQRKLNALLFTWRGVPSFEGSLCRECPEESSAKYGRFFWCANNRVEFEGMQDALKGEFQVVGFRTLLGVQERHFRNYRNLVQVYADHIERIQPEGDYVLGGFCDGGRIIVELALELESRGKRVKHVVLNNYICEQRLNTKVSMIFSKTWDSNPLSLWESPELAWQKNFGQNYGVLESEGVHGDYGSEDFQAELRSFILSEREREPSSESQVTQRILQPNCTIKPMGSIPRIMKFGAKYSAKFLITNRGEETIYSDDGIVLHGRWVDLNKPKYGSPMRTKLKEPLNPGDSVEISLDLSPKKKNRLYCIQVGLIEEGQAWPTGSRLFKKWIATI